jgi:hypothetical protein
MQCDNCPICIKMCISSISKDPHKFKDCRVAEDSHPEKRKGTIVIVKVSDPIGIDELIRQRTVI